MSCFHSYQGFFEERKLLEEVDVLERLVLRDTFDGTEVVSSLSRDANLLNAMLGAS